MDADNHSAMKITCKKRSTNKSVDQRKARNTAGEPIAKPERFKPNKVNEGGNQLMGLRLCQVGSKDTRKNPMEGGGGKRVVEGQKRKGGTKLKKTGTLYPKS